MAEKIPLHETIERAYGKHGLNLGGWAGVEEICSTKLPYEHKINEIQRRYHRARITAARWHAWYMKLNGLS